MQVPGVSNGVDGAAALLFEGRVPCHVAVRVWVWVPLVVEVVQPYRLRYAPHRLCFAIGGSDGYRWHVTEEGR